jgi:hypothetical protein
MDDGQPTLAAFDTPRPRTQCRAPRHANDTRTPAFASTAFSALLATLTGHSSVASYANQIYKRVATFKHMPSVVVVGSQTQADCCTSVTIHRHLASTIDASTAKRTETLCRPKFTENHADFSTSGPDAARPHHTTPTPTPAGLPATPLLTNQLASANTPPHSKYPITRPR